MITTTKIPVSVILPVFNGENYLAEAIDSVLRQSHPNIELIVVDDGSTDSTPNIVKRCAPKAVYIYQSNQGLGASRNAGVSVATSEYIAFIDHDDRWAYDKLSTQLKHLLKYAECLDARTLEETSLFKSLHPDQRRESLQLSTNTHEPLIFSYVQQFPCPTLSADEISNLLINEVPMPGYCAGTLLVSKASFKAIGPFWDKHDAGEFIDWFMRAKDMGIPMIMCPEIHSYRRIHRSNMGRQTSTYDRRGYLIALKSSLVRRRGSQKCDVNDSRNDLSSNQS